jgi:hypothetical protein
MRDKSEKGKKKGKGRRIMWNEITYKINLSDLCASLEEKALWIKVWPPLGRQREGFVSLRFPGCRFHAKPCNYET